MSLRSQLLVSKSFRVHNAPKRINEDVRVIPVIKPPFKLFYVAVHVLDGHLMECSNDGTLEQAPDSLDAVDMNITSYPFLFGVGNGFMAGIMIFNSEIGFPFIGIYGFSFVFHSPLDESVKSLPLGVGDSFNTNLPASLDGSGNPCFIALVSPAFALCFSTYQCFVHLHDSYEGRTFKRFITHSLTDPVAEIPCCPVVNSESSFYLVGRDSFLGLTHKIDGDKPFSQGQMGIMHNSSTGYRELVTATLALKTLLFWKWKNFDRPATGAVNTMRPADVFKCLTALIICLKLIH